MSYEINDGYLLFKAIENLINKIDNIEKKIDKIDTNFQNLINELKMMNQNYKFK